MKGLLVKDYHLMFQRKLTIVVFIALCVFMGVSMDGAFIIGYMTILGAIFALGTISYDDIDGGMLFLMTLPIERKTYAASKYIFSIIVCVVSMAVSVIIMFAINIVRGTPVDITDSIFTAATIFPVAVIILDILIPLQLKFGTEKGRIVLIVIAAVIFASVTLINEGIFDKGNVSSLVKTLDSMSPAASIGGAFILCIILTVISAIISSRIMEKKSF